MRETKIVRVPNCQKCKKRSTWTKLHPSTFLCESCQAQREQWSEARLCPDCGSQLEYDSWSLNYTCIICSWQEIKTKHIKIDPFKRKKLLPIPRMKSGVALIDKGGLLAILKNPVSTKIKGCKAYIAK